ncbi:helix-turn-helix domain-containing protein [Nocardioides humi]
MAVVRGGSFRGFSAAAPLSRHHETTDPRVARDIVSTFLAPHHLTVAEGRERFRAVGDHVELGAVSLAYVSYGTEVVIDRGGSQDYVGVVVPLSGSVVVRQAGQEVVATNGGSFAAVASEPNLHMRWSADSQALVLRAQTGALRALADRIAPYGRHDALTFRPSRVVGSEAAVLAGLTELLVHLCQACGPPEAMPGLIRRHLGEQALVAILLAVPNSSTEQLLDQTPGLRSSVRRVLDLVAAETEATYTVSALATAAGVGVRALEVAFRRDLGTTPHAFLQRVRLEKARQELLAAGGNPGTTVTAVAVRWGFSNVGRFAGLYQQHFGVLPSQTLNRRG